MLKKGWRKEEKSEDRGEKERGRIRRRGSDEKGLEKEGKK